MDAATLSLERILGSGEYEAIRDVPVFDEHDEPLTEEQAIKAPLFVVRNRDGSLVRRFDRKALEYIAARCNERAAGTGDLGLFGPGHTIPDQWKDGIMVKKAPETEQPPPWGISTNWRVGDFGPRQKLGLLCDLYARREHAEAVKRDFPRRSVELWLQDGMIDWIALLRRTPKRDLGLLMNARRGLCLRYSMEDSGMPDFPADKPADKPPAGDPTETPPDAADPNPEEAAQYDRMWSYFMKQPLMQYMAQCMQQAQAGANQPSVGAAPAGAPPAGAPPASEPPGVDRMSRDEQERLARYERENVEKDRRIAALEKVGRDAQRRNKLLELQSQGYDVEPDKEMVRCERYSDDQFRDHTILIVEKYSRDPSSRPMIPVLKDAVSEPLGPDEISERHLKVALQYQRDNYGCEWAKALEETKQFAGR